MSNTELPNFASWFHQDFGVIFDNFDDGVDRYIGGLSENRKAVLASELRELLNQYPGKSSKGLKNAWIRLGAQWWDKEKMPKLLHELSNYK